MERDRSDRLSLAVVEAIAEEEGVESVALHPPLFEVIDPDALDELFSTGNPESAEIVFHYLGYEVHARSDGSVELCEPNGEVPTET